MYATTGDSPRRQGRTTAEFKGLGTQSGAGADVTILGGGGFSEVPSAASRPRRNPLRRGRELCDALASSLSGRSEAPPSIQKELKVNIFQ